MPHYIADMPWTEVAELAERTPLILVPSGATEAHGPHLPLDTDMIVARGSCRRTADRLEQLGIECAIAPPLVLGVTRFGMPFAGNISLDEDTLYGIIDGVCRSLATHGFTQIVISNHHLEPAHFNTIKQAVADINEAGIADVAAPDIRIERWASMLSEEFRAGARHGGSYETSLVMAERPDLVRHEARMQLEPLYIDLPDRIHNHGATTFKEAGSPLAYFGDPASASVEEGEQLFAALVDMLVTTADELSG